jgi:electron transport complex protein RnfA
MISDILYYLIYTSAVLIYGIGTNRATVVCLKPNHIVLYFVKMIITVSCSTALIYLLTKSLLIPISIAELYPFIAVLVFSAVSVFIESLIRITSKITAAEFGVSLLCVLLAVNESTSLVQSVLIACLCTVSFYLFVPVIYSIRKRIEIGRPASDFENSSLILISVAIIMIVLVVWNVSWLNPGVFQ